MPLRTDHIIALVISLIGFVLAVRHRNSRMGYFWLFVLALGIRYVLATFTDLLNLWDEEYHAVVAKHMAENPLRPTLYPYHVIPYDIAVWTGIEVWLHKPPFFLWVIAGSIKTFGAEVWSVRLPSVILSAATCWLAADSTRLVTSLRAGWWAGLFMVFSLFPLKLLTGVIPTDHNDVFFVFLVGLSFWLWLQYRKAPSMRGSVLIGVAVAAAVLTKWLTGLWIFLPWGLSLLAARDVRQWLHLGVSLLVAIALVTPWYLYIFNTFPAEAALEMKYNSRHFFEALEGHDGSFLHPFLSTWEHYRIGLIFIVLGIIPIFRREKFIAIGILFVFVFFAIAATKMPAFSYMMAVPLSIALGTGFLRLWDGFGQSGHNYFLIPLVGVILWFNVLPLAIIGKQKLHTENRQNRFQWSRNFTAWNDAEDRSKWVVFGLPAGSERLFLFYTDAIGYHLDWQDCQSHYNPKSNQIWADWNNGEPVVLSHEQLTSKEEGADLSNDNQP